MDDLGPSDVAMWDMSDVRFDYPLARDAQDASGGEGRIDLEDAASRLRQAASEVRGEVDSDAGIVQERRQTREGEVWTLSDEAVRQVGERLRLRRGR